MLHTLYAKSGVLRTPVQFFTLGALAVSMTACSTDEGAPAPSLSTGVFLDSAVSGLGYATDTLSGQTDLDGVFEFNAGESVVFSIGGFALPEVQASAFVTPLSIFGAADVQNPQARDLARLLQSLDEDSDVSDGISFPPEVQSITSDTQIDFGTDSFDAQATAVVQQVMGDQAQLVDGDTATAHLTQTLIANNLISDDCTSDHLFVGRTAELSTRSHGVTGTITILNDCTIAVSQFNYDGGGPAVYFYAGVGQNYASNSFPIGPRLNGRQWVNDSLLLPIPEGMSLDDFDSLSVWCFDFNANFGDAFFGDS